MNPAVFRSCFVFASGLALANALFAETPKVGFPAASPPCAIKQHVGFTDIATVHSRPGVKGRAIYGGIVPSNELWRTTAIAAAKQSTELTIQAEAANSSFVRMNKDLISNLH